MDARRVYIRGVVQGVGFRPFIHGLAARCGVRGWVRNTAGGVELAIEGEPPAIDAFLAALPAEAPPLARLESLHIEPATPAGYVGFEIRSSLTATADVFQPVSPDMAICSDCERELFDPNDRRYLYPFINCTNCGPRFTIIRGLPYDRPLTSMAAFTMCAACAREYSDPEDRRFHAQPIACPACGPQVWLTEPPQAFDLLPAGKPPVDRSPEDPILQARQLLSDGAILAIKGLGGFHLACDAANPRAVAELRRRKRRTGKPFALMLADLATVAEFCHLDQTERELLTGREKPIVILKRKSASELAPAVAPGLDTLGVMLPYTPLHHLLLNQTDATLARYPAPRALVMTSGNLAEEPIATDNAEAIRRLASLADAFLLHNRGIDHRCDDSVVRVCAAAPVLLRAARGYAPTYIALPHNMPPTLAVGAELKNTFCLTRERYACLSQHIGDMENAETLAAFEHSVEHFCRFFRVTPEIIAHDLHPDYLTTRWAQQQTTPARKIAVQHHHAHIAACLADNGLSGTEPVIGLAFDGTGLGADGTIWGGEFLIADYRNCRRTGHLEYLPLPGGDTAIRNPWRIAVAYAAALGLDIDGLAFLNDLDHHAVAVVRHQIARRLNAPLTSSLGRLFDAVAALAGVRNSVTLEAQAAIELESLAERTTDQHPYAYELEIHAGQIIVRLKKLLAEVIADARRATAAAIIAARFHTTLAELVTEVCRHLYRETGLRTAALSGGVWQNRNLLELTIARLRAAGFVVYTHRQVPPNDGGIALGQAAIAAQVAAANERR